MNCIAKLFRLVIALALMQGLMPGAAHAQYPIRVNVNVQQPVPPYLPQIKANIMGNRTGQLNQDISNHLAVTLTNSGSTQTRVKLSATIQRLSPAPMSISLRPDYQPANPIGMNPQQMVRLNQSMLNEAFGGFTQDDLAFQNADMGDLRQGAVNYKLPEGTYRICITAYDFEKPGQSAPLSAPGTGCATFIICYRAAAPQLVMPVSTMMQSNSGFQDFTPHTPQVQFTWTPPATTCGTPLGALTYDLEIRKAFPGQTVKDVSMNPPVFHQRNIPTTTFLLDTLRFPHVLRAGERYTVRVKANFQARPGSPLEIANEGYSQIGAFVYTPPAEQATGQLAETPPRLQMEMDAPQYATNQISGRLLWAFKQSEETFAGTPPSSPSAASNPATQSGSALHAGVTTPDISMTPVGMYVGSNAIQAQHAVAMGQADPTLSSASTNNTLATYFSSAASAIPPQLNKSANEIISSNAAQSVRYEYRHSGTDTAQQRYPLPNITVVLKGKKKTATTPQPKATFVAAGPNVKPYTVADDVKYGGLRTVTDWPGMIQNNEGDAPSNDMGGEHSSLTNISDIGLKVLASGTTDAEGNYTLNFIHPKFSGLEQYEELVLTVNAPGFYDFEYRIPTGEIDSLSDIHLGDRVLLANTYRFSATVNAPTILGNEAQLGNMQVRLYRESQEITQSPYLAQEGNVPAEARETKTINRKRYVLVAIDSVGEHRQKTQLFDFGKLFYEGSLLAVVQSAADNLGELKTDIRVTPQQASVASVMQVYAGYDATPSDPAVKGRVVLYAGDNTVSIPHAVVKVTYNPDDVLSGGPPPLSEAEIAAQILNSRPEALDLPAGVILDPVLDPLEFSTTSAIGNVAMPMEVSASMGVSSPNAGMEGQFNVQPVASAWAPTGIDPDLLDAATMGNDSGPYTTRSDESGNFYIGNLPILKPDAEFTIELVSVPFTYRGLAVQPENKKINRAIVAGITAEAAFQLNAEVTPLAGRVVDATGKAMPYAQLHFEGSDTYFDTDGSGAFQTSFYPGTHTLIVEKTGYVKKEGEIRIEENQVTVDTILRPELREQMVVSGPGLAMAPMMPSIDASMEAYTATLAFPEAANEALNMGEIGYLNVKRARVRFIVKDEADPTKVLEGVSISLFDTTQVTNERGEWLYRGFGGKVDVTLIPQDGSGYLPVETSVDLQADNQLIEMTLLMEQGTRLYGTVSSSNTPLDSVHVSVEGKKYLAALSQEDGSYELYLPAGEQEIRVAKIGYMVHKTYQTFQKGNDVQLDFSLEGGGGKNISQLLGFQIELEKADSAANGAEIWTGSFVGLNPYLSVFEPDGRLSLPFANINVTFDEEGNAIPENKEVVTDAVDLPLTLFGYLPLTFQNDGDQIVITENANGWGSISGQLQLDPGRILGQYDVAFIETLLPKVITKDRTSPGSIEIFLGAGARGLPGLGAENMGNLEDAATDAAQDIAGNLPGNSDALADLQNEAQNIQDEVEGYIVDAENLEFRLATEGTEPVKIELYGFTVELDLANTTVSPDGLTLAGDITTPQFGPVTSIDIPLKTLMLDRTFAITEVEIPTDQLPVLEVGDWKASLTALVINESGLKLGGEIDVKLPASDVSTLAFSDLRITKDGVYGGKFEVSRNGIDLFDAAVIKSAGSELRFGQIGNSGVYSLSGAVDMLFKKLIDAAIEIPRFQIQTDGHFAVQVPANYSADFGFASYHINGFAVSNATGQLPYVELLGELSTDIPFLDFSAGNIRFQATESGSAELIVGKIAASLDVPVMECGLELELKENGFAGGGSLEIPNTSIGADITFHYFKERSGIDMGASFVVGAPIPIGAITIAKVGGGFSYNTGNNKFAVTITGEASVANLSQAVKLADIELTVESGPIIKGSTEVVVGDNFELASSKLELNFPAKLFAITVDANMEPMEGLSKASLNGLMRVSWDTNNPYAFLGVNTTIKVASLLDTYGEFALGVNVKNPKYGDNDIAQYFRNLDDDLMGGGNYTFSGLYAYGGVEIGPPNPKIGGDFWIASFSATYHASASACFLVNFAEGDYLLSFKGNVSASAKACIDLWVWDGCMEAGFNACFGFAGGRTSQKGWFFKGNVGAALTFKVGSLNPGCNDWTVDKGFWYVNFGAKGCISAHAGIDYGQYTGLKLSGGLGGSNSGNLCL